jgi:hypothetical protein
MPEARFERTIPVFEWAKTFHALDSAATVISSLMPVKNNIYNYNSVYLITT